MPLTLSVCAFLRHVSCCMCCILARPCVVSCLMPYCVVFCGCRINSKLREKGKKEEQRRLRDFVDAAYRLDPRIAARKEMQAAER